MPFFVMTYFHKLGEFIEFTVCVFLNWTERVRLAFVVRYQVKVRFRFFDKQTKRRSWHEGYKIR